MAVRANEYLVHTLLQIRPLLSADSFRYTVVGVPIALVTCPFALRNIEETLTSILSGLSWLGIDWDEASGWEEPPGTGVVRWPTSCFVRRRDGLRPGKPR